MHARICEEGAADSRRKEFHMNTKDIPPQKALLITDHQAAALLGLSRSTFWRRVADRSLPRPLRIGGATRWRREEIAAFVENLADERDAAAIRRPSKRISSDEDARNGDTAPSGQRQSVPRSLTDGQTP